MKGALGDSAKLQNLEKEGDKRVPIATLPCVSPASCFLPKPYRTAFPKQDLEEEVAELFYDVIKDFPELTFGVISIPQAAGRFHVTLDSVLVFRKVGLGSYCWRGVSRPKAWTTHVCVGFVYKCCACHL